LRNIPNITLGTPSLSLSDLHYSSRLSRPRTNSTTMARKNPNIVITGTPGVGKTTHAEQLARSTGFKHLSVNQIVKDEGFHEGKDEETGSWIVDEDKVRSCQFPLMRIYTANPTSSSTTSKKPRSPPPAATSSTGTRATSFPSAGSTWSSCCAAIPRSCMID
jgi:hypothetical protein